MVESRDIVLRIKPDPEGVIERVGGPAGEEGDPSSEGGGVMEGIWTEVISPNGFIGCQSLFQVRCLVQPVMSIVEVWVGG